MKNLIVFLMAVCMTVSLVGCSSFQEGVEAGMEAAKNPVEEKEDKSDEKIAPVEQAVEQEAEKEPEVKEEVDTEEEKTETAEVIQEEETAPEQTGSINVLMTAPLKEYDVKNGTKTEVIGTRAQIIVDKELMELTTNEEFKEFCDIVVKDSGYNWLTISFGNGYGIQFPGSMTYYAEYGKLDNEGCIEELIGNIMLQEDGTYKYLEIE